MPPSEHVNNISLFISPKLPAMATGKATSRAPISSKQTACVCGGGVCEGGRRPLTGESKEKAHSLLKTRSPVLGTLMVGM